MSGENATIRGSNKVPIGASKDGHLQMQSTFPLMKLPKRKRIGRTPIQLDNIPCSLVYIQNPIDNATVYVGGVGDDIVKLDEAYAGDTEAAIIYEGMIVPFMVENANLLTVVSEAENTTIHYWTYLNQPQDQTLDREPLPEVDTTRPFVQSHNPLAGQTDVERDISIQVNMNEDIDLTTVTPTNITILPSVAANYSVNEASPSQIVIDPTSDLAAATTYTIALQPLGVKDLAGNSIAALYSFNFTTKAAAPPPDTTPPTVTARSPGVGATGVAITASVVIDWSEALNAATVNGTTVQLSVVTGEVVTLSNQNKRITITPAASLAFNTTYQVTLTTGIQDVAGNPIAAQIQWTFQTTGAPDTTPPTITASNPLNNAIDVAVSIVPTITWSEALNPAFVNENTFDFFNNDTVTEIAYTVSLNTPTNTIVTLTPSSNLLHETNYRITATTQVRDAAGNQITSAQNRLFRTIIGQDTTPPAIVTGTSTPTAGQSGLPLDTVVVLNWNEPLNPTFVTATTFNLKNNGTNAVIPHTSALVTGSNQQQVKITPSSLLAYGTTYRVEITTAVRDIATPTNNQITSQINRTFSTQAQTDFTAPVITNRTPGDNAQNIGISTDIVVTFNEPLDVNSVNNTVFQLIDNQTQGTVTCNVIREINDTVVRMTPTQSLFNSRQYKARINRNSVRDKAGNAMTGGAFDWLFTTIALPLSLQYNVSGTGSWNPIGLESSNGNDRVGRGIRQKSTTTTTGSLYNKAPKKAIFRVRRDGDLSSGEDNELYCRIRDSNGNIKGDLGTYPGATDITDDEDGQLITFENSGQTYIMQQNDSLLIEYFDGDADDGFQVESASQSGGGPNSNTVEVYYENESSDDFSEQGDRDVACQVYV